VPEQIGHFPNSAHEVLYLDGCGRPESWHMRNTPDNRYLSVRHVAERFDVSVNTVWRWAALNPRFPKPIKLGPGCSRWRLADLAEFETSVETRS
jgi:predicted DNA-binding transcriptional regulator AlpA